MKKFLLSVLCALAIMPVYGETFDIAVGNVTYSVETTNASETTVLTTGGIFAYVNGKEYTDYTGNSDRLDSKHCHT